MRLPKSRAMTRSNPWRRSRLSRAFSVSATTRISPGRPPTNRPIRCPAVAPAARLSTPTKSPSPGWPETNCTTRTPRSRSRAVASRTCGDSGAISATPSSASRSIADKEARDLVRLLAHHAAVAHLDELAGEDLPRLLDARDHRLEELVAVLRQQVLEAVGAPPGQVGGRRFRTKPMRAIASLTASTVGLRTRLGRSARGRPSRG